LILITAQPLQASFCETNAVVDGGHMAQQAMDTGSSNSDCCDQDRASPSDSCSPLAHCGAVFSEATLLNASSESGSVSMALTAGHQPSFKSAPLSQRFVSPPFRPPIS